MDSVDLQKQFYDSRWSQSRFAGRLQLLRSISILEALADLKLKDPKIIDLCCGAGWLTAIIGLFGPAVGVELSELAVKIASKKYPHVHFIQADIFNWDYPREQFDIVVSQEAIEHVEDQDGYLEIAYGLLSKGGYLILTTPNYRTFYAMPAQQRTSWSNQPIENWLTIEGLKALLARRFKIIKVTTIIPGWGVKGSYRFINSRCLKTTSRIMGLEGIFDKIRLGLGYGLHTFAVARKV